MSTGIMPEEMMMCCHRSWDKGKAKTWVHMLSQSVRLNRVIIVVAGSTYGGPSVNTGRCNVVIKDSKDWIRLVVQQWWNLQITWQLRPLCTANRAGDIAMPDVGGNA